MGKFCFECWGRVNDIDPARCDIALSKELRCCGNCRRKTHMVIYYRRKCLIRRALWKIFHR